MSNLLSGPCNLDRRGWSCHHGIRESTIDPQVYTHTHHSLPRSHYSHSLFRWLLTELEPVHEVVLVMVLLLTVLESGLAVHVQTVLELFHEEVLERVLETVLRVVPGVVYVLILGAHLEALIVAGHAEGEV